MKKIILIIILATTIFANPLIFLKGSVTAHTEVIGDSTINPTSSGIISHFTIQDNILSLKGSVDVLLTNFNSDNSSRDKHMCNLLNIMKYAKTTFTIQSIIKNENDSNNNQYTLKGTLNLHGITKAVNLHGNILFNNKILTLQMTTSFKMSDFGITPPSLLFFDVRDLVDINIDTSYFKN